MYCEGRLYHWCGKMATSHTLCIQFLTSVEEVEYQRAHFWTRQIFTVHTDEWSEITACALLIVWLRIVNAHKLKYMEWERSDGEFFVGMENRKFLFSFSVFHTVGCICILFCTDCYPPPSSLAPCTLRFCTRKIYWIHFSIVFVCRRHEFFSDVVAVAAVVSYVRKIKMVAITWA